jgi:multidrug efflux pump subunit AcrA (membrane-fusion protein)
MIKKSFFVSSAALIFILWCFFSVTGCSQVEDLSKKKEAIPVKVIKVELKDIQKTLDYVGDIKAQDEAIIYPKVDGKIIEKIAEEGSSVNKGDVIAYIDRDEVGFKFEKAPVESPLTGIIGRVYVDKGTNVTPQTPVALVVDMDKVKVDLDIPEEYLPKVILGQSAEISLQTYPDEKFIGTVVKISPVLDLATRTAPIEINIPNSDHRLKSGMFASVSLIIEKHASVPVIFKEAIMGKEPDNYVYLIENNKAMTKKIILGIHDGPYYEVREGIKEGDLVVIVGQQRLYDNAPVTVEQ